MPSNFAWPINFPRKKFFHKEIWSSTSLSWVSFKWLRVFLPPFLSTTTPFAKSWIFTVFYVFPGFVFVVAIGEKHLLITWCQRHKGTKLLKRTWKYFLTNKISGISYTNCIVDKKRLKRKSKMCLSGCGKTFRLPGSSPLNNTPFQFIQSILIFIMFWGD